MRRLCGLALALSAGISLASAAHAEQPAFVVFFQEWSAAIDGPAHDVISQAATWVKDHPGSTARVLGYADPTGSRKANVLLSQLRAQVVSDGLVEAGMSAAQVKPVGEGSAQFANAPLESRRVEILVRP